MRRVHLLLAASLLAAACGADQYESKTSSQELPATPKGTLSGQVLTSRLTPMDSADVTLTIGGTVATKKVSTDENGSFAFTGLPGGSQVLLTVTKAGYTTVRETATIPAAAGDFPLDGANVNVGPFTLAKLGATVRFTVLAPRGAPAYTAKATLEVSPAGSDLSQVPSPTGAGLSAYVADATVDAAGVLAFANVPDPAEIARYNGNYKLWIAPLDANTDGIPESGGYAASYPAASLVTDPSPRFVQLLPLSGGTQVRVDGGNVGSLKSSPETLPLKNMVKPGEPLLIVFSQPVVEQSLLVRFTNEDASSNLGFAKTLSAGGQILTITPEEALVPGAEYNLKVQATAVNGTAYQQTGFFFGGDPASPPEFALKNMKYQETSTALPSRLTTGERVYVNLNQAITMLGNEAEHVQVFFSSDIDGDNKVGGDTIGELGNSHGKGIDLVADEPSGPLPTSLISPESPLFPIKSSGYTTRWSFVYPGSVTLDPGAIEITVAYSALARRTANTYVTLWGEPIQTDVKASPAIIPPPEGTEN